jgi:segregation and condensation protein B
MRGTTSGPVLAQLVRRALLRIDRSAAQRPSSAHYFTTPRFLKLFGLTSLQDLPRSGEVE